MEQTGTMSIVRDIVVEWRENMIDKYSLKGMVLCGMLQISVQDIT